MALPHTNHETILTAYGSFFKYSPARDAFPRSVLLRGVNLSSTAKFPRSTRSQAQVPGARKARDVNRLQASGIYRRPEDAKDYFWSDAEEGGPEGWFNDAPFLEEEADVSKVSVSVKLSSRSTCRV